MKPDRTRQPPCAGDAFENLAIVSASDIDEQQHVNNAVYLRWVQEVATAHWRALASAEEQARIYWVVLRHEIDYMAPALLGQEVLLRTWVGEASRLTFERHTTVSRASDQQQLAQARTLWCPMNVATRKPTRVSAEVRAQFSARPVADEQQQD